MSTSALKKSIGLTDTELNKSSRKKTRLPSYVDKANYISRLYCLYAGTFLLRILNRDVDLNVISECAEEDKCEALATALEKNWNKELELRKSGKKANFARAFLKTFAFRFLIGCIPNFLVYGIGKMIAPVILGRIIFYSNKFAEQQAIKNQSEILVSNISSKDFDIIFVNDSFRNQVMFWSGMLALVISMNFLISHPYWMYRFRNGMQIKVAITRLVYQKSLRMPMSSIQKFGVGKIVNLIANDANRFEVVTLYCEFIFMCIPELAVAMIILYNYTGLASLGCLAILLIYAPFQCYMANVLSRFRSKSIVLTDDRLRLMSEILPAMRVIKMYVWEKPFAALVHLARKLEIIKIRHAMILRSINLSLYFASPKLMAFVVIIIYLSNESKMSAEVVFVTLSLVFQLRDLMTYFLPQGISYSVEAYISSKRIESYLLEEETEKVEIFNKNVDIPSIEVKNINVFSPVDQTSILQDITFDVEPGKLTVIIGPVGSGKSSILMSILKEMQIRSGSIKTNGNVIYVSQEAWIFNGTVRENILFGRPFDSDLYREVIRASALVKDIAGFEDGDLEKIDDRGTSLSGGQRARISLARALYADADCYLLDDPLSAVDASVAKHIFEKCIKHHLSNKCVILVTHQLQFIKSADQILVLKDGIMLACGSYTELLTKGIDVFKYSVQVKSEQQENTNQSPAIDSDSLPFRFRTESNISDIFPSRNTSFRSGSFIGSDMDSSYDKMSMIDRNIYSCIEKDEKNDSGRNYCEETSYSTGQKIDRLQLYWIYIRAGGGILLFTLFFCSNILTQVLFTGSDYWLSIWTDYQEKVQIEGNNDNVQLPSLLAPNDSDNKLIYSFLVFFLFVNSIIRTVSYFVICSQASVNLHNRIFSSLIEAPMIFFDKTPIGVIMNRVSRDLGIIDDLIPPTAFEAIDILTNSIGIFIICAYANQYVLIPFVFLVIMVYIANKFYVNFARKIKKLEAIARSPIFNKMSSTISGLSTIRAYHAENMLLQSFSNVLDIHTSTLYMFYSCSRLYGIFLEVLCLIYLYCLIFILNIFLEDYPASVIGLTISQSLMLTNAFNWGIRQYTEVETQMTSVERVVEFGNLEKENLDNCEKTPDKSWPEKGELTLSNVTLQYSFINDETGEKEYRTVLKNLSLNIAGGEKIGIVGRTGAGKSSLITALFRLTQPTGIIKIDGYDTAKISLINLRSNLSIIPQEPILFSGSVRRNLDPFGSKSDEEIWEALSKVQLANKVRELPQALDSESGNDFSVGQRQLICLARAILRNNKILILDEATANVDPRTDALIQSNIRSEFLNCTVLTIAHRLNTVIDYDKILVLDQGEVAQFDTPYALIKSESGIFYELFTNLNTETRRDLKKQAYEAEQRRLCKQSLDKS